MLKMSPSIAWGAVESGGSGWAIDSILTNLLGRVVPVVQALECDQILLSKSPGTGSELEMYTVGCW